MTTNWDAESVLAASTAWTWVPDGAPHVRTAEYLVVAYPEHFVTPTAARVLGSDRPAGELVDEVADVVRGWGRERLWWRLSDTTRPASLEAEVVARGARLADRMDVLALPLGPGRSLPDLQVPADVQVEAVVDERTVRDALVVGADAFGAEEPSADQVATALADVEQGLAAGTSGRWVASVDGQPAATGGFTLADGVCRLWGGGTRATLRGRGAYRAVLAARLVAARDAGATLALTHGVVETSSPILRRAGFTRYGEERTLVQVLA